MSDDSNENRGCCLGTALVGCWVSFLWAGHGVFLTQWSVTVTTTYESLDQNREKSVAAICEAAHFCYFWFRVENQMEPSDSRDTHGNRRRRFAINPISALTTTGPVTLGLTMAKFYPLNKATAHRPQTSKELASQRWCHKEIYSGTCWSCFFFFF